MTPAIIGTGGIGSIIARQLASGDESLQHRGITDDARACALAYNVVCRGQTELPQAGFAVYVRGESGKLDAARIYDDAERYA